MIPQKTKDNKIIRTIGFGPVNLVISHIDEPKWDFIELKMSGDTNENYTNNSFHFEAKQHLSREDLIQIRDFLNELKLHE